MKEDSVSFNDMIKPKERQHPLLLRYYIARRDFIRNFNYILRYF